MHFDGETLFALVLLTVPMAVLAYRHAVEWGAGFGAGSGVWRPSTVLAALFLIVLVALTLGLGADGFRAALGSRRSRGYLPFFLLPGVGLAIILFPGPASELVGRYKELTMERATRSYAWVGWGLIALWTGLLCLGWFARYRK